MHVVTLKMMLSMSFKKSVIYRSVIRNVHCISRIDNSTEITVYLVMLRGIHIKARNTKFLKAY